jgi:hypothetical protein
MAVATRDIGVITSLVTLMSLTVNYTEVTVNSVVQDAILSKLDLLLLVPVKSCLCDHHHMRVLLLLPPPLLLLLLLSHSVCACSWNLWTSALSTLMNIQITSAAPAVTMTMTTAMMTVILNHLHQLPGVLFDYAHAMAFAG